MWGKITILTIFISMGILWMSSVLADKPAGYQPLEIPKIFDVRMPQSGEASGGSLTVEHRFVKPLDTVQLRDLTIQDQIRQLEPELADTLIALAKCESSLNPMAVGDHGKSYGLYQIHQGYWGKEVNIKQSQDVEFSTKWTAQKFREGKWYLWTCARKFNLKY